MWCHTIISGSGRFVCISAPVDRTMSGFAFSTECAVWWSDSAAMCSLHFLYFFPEFVGLLGESIARRIETARDCLIFFPEISFLTERATSLFRIFFISDFVLCFPSSSNWCFLPLFCAKWSSDELKEPPSFSSLLDLWKAEQKRNSATLLYSESHPAFFDLFSYT